MIKVTNKHELRLAYDVLECYKRFFDKCDLQINDKMVRQKREIRRYNRREYSTLANGIEYKTRIVKDYGIDGALFLIEFRRPWCVHDVNDLEHIFDRYIRINMPHFEWDCTGKPFTSWHKCFRRNGKFMIYHRVCCDV